MMNKLDWTQSVIIGISRIADSEYQIRGWINQEFHPWVTFVETICKLNDDADFRNFVALSEGQFHFPKVLCENLRRFSALFDAYVDKHGWAEDPDIIVADPEWHTVQASAQTVLDEFKKLNLFEKFPTWRDGMSKTG
ncbi:MAG: hypothetical protein JSS32_03295 [Verrucomicrobia bacterium]|nr:hypothetical protein [Verrucomicrobiota bacterium]